MEVASTAIARDLLFPNGVRWFWLLRLARCTAVGAIATDANWRTLTQEIVAKAHANGLRVACYTCNDLANAERLWGWGADSVITDAVDKISFRRT